ncbi:MAG: tripartite tricarboxylate transporter substrate binding protein, partial [Pseudomonadota bacterium]|nr:tripartite tricarboxylate transporter substrate binding protein [Pseudomonadota bacterium]
MTSTYPTRLLALLIAVAPLLAPPAAAAQSNYPAKAIVMVVPLAAGSAVDVAARIVAQKMSASMGQAIVVENLPGA